MEPGAFSGFLRTALFRVDETVVTGADVVACGVLCGELQTLEGVTAIGLNGLEPDDFDVRSEVVALRRRRRLTSASDYREWLAYHGVSVADANGFARRSVAARREGNAGATALPPAALDLLYVDGVCGDYFRRSARHLIDQLLAVADVGLVHDAPVPAVWSTWLDGGSPVVPALDDAVGLVGAGSLAARRAASLDVLRASLTSETAVRRCLARRAGEWEVVTFHRLDFAFEGAAREAALLLAEPGGIEAAERHARRSDDESVTVADVSDELSWELIRSRAEPTAPVWADADGGWHTAVVLARRWPVETDPAVVERAAAVLVSERLDKLRPGHVTSLVQM